MKPDHAAGVGWSGGHQVGRHESGGLYRFGREQHAMHRAAGRTCDMADSSDGETSTIVVVCDLLTRPVSVVA